jgi:hypothetical protein
MSTAASCNTSYASSPQSNANGFRNWVSHVPTLGHGRPRSLFFALKSSPASLQFDCGGVIFAAIVWNVAQFASTNAAFAGVMEFGG